MPKQTNELNFLQDCYQVLKINGIIIINTHYLSITDALKFEELFITTFPSFHKIVHQQNNIYIGFK
jgi:predicted SAM-dependent methyltransferase